MARRDHHGDTIDQALANNETTLETRELVWELSQPHIDRARIRFLIDTGASVRDALRLADIDEKQLMKSPQLRVLQLHRHLASHAPA